MLGTFFLIGQQFGFQAAILLRVGAARGETAPWARTLAEAAAFRGWSWDAQAALTQSSRLLPRG